MVPLSKKHCVFDGCPFGRSFARSRWKANLLDLANAWPGRRHPLHPENSATGL
jgi:hypothetical protein